MDNQSIRVIAGFAGVGKTTLAKKYPDIFVDFVAMPYKYHLEEYKSADKSDEGSKANPDNILRDDWPDNYVSAIQEAIKNSSKILLIPSDFRVLYRLGRENIGYRLFYPSRESRVAYQKRFTDRGNTADFLEVFIGGWDNFMDYLENDQYGLHVVMEPGQFLEDVISVNMNEWNFTSGR